MTPQDYLRIALDPIRLAVLGRSAEGPIEMEGLAASLDVPLKKVQDAVGALRAAGLLGEDLRLNRDALRGVAASLPSFEPADVPDGEWTAEEVTVLGRFFVWSRLR